SSPSALIAPANNLMNVVLPVPFSPSITIISESDMLTLPNVFFISGYLYLLCFSTSFSSSAVSASLNVKDSSRNLRFSVGTLPSKNILIPSRIEKGIVTTPYTEGTP
ncbi:hypothetical protein GLOIN_2v1467226, partial [Rhizophagus irregularis DAOM 181602=DAOM 197198]